MRLKRPTNRHKRTPCHCGAAAARGPLKNRGDAGNVFPVAPSITQILTTDKPFWKMPLSRLGMRFAVILANLADALAGAAWRWGV